MGDAVDAYPKVKKPATIAVRMPRVRMLTGVALDPGTCRDALTRLGCTVGGADEQLEVTPPSARSDITREVDVIEEILRVSGYEQVKSTLPPMRQAPPVQKPDRASTSRPYSSTSSPSTRLGVMRT